MRKILLATKNPVEGILSPSWEDPYEIIGLPRLKDGRHGQLPPEGTFSAARLSHLGLSANHRSYGWQIGLTLEDMQV